MRVLLTALLLTVSLTSCKKPPPSNVQPAGAQVASTLADATPQQAGQPLEIKYLRGSIGNALDMQMKLVRDGDKLTGSYFYRRVGARIDLKGTIDRDNHLTLEEFDAAGQNTGIFKGLWTIKQEDGTVNIVGNWSQPDGQKRTAFSLHEEPIHLSGAAELIAKTIKESNKKLRYEIQVEYPQLTGLLSDGMTKFNQQASRLALREVNEFKKNLADSATENSEQPSSVGSSLEIGYTVVLATDDLLSIQFSVGTYYQGAAHPNSISRVLNFDVKGERTLRLGDLFKSGAKYLQVLSNYAIKDLKKQSAEANGPLFDEASIESGAAATAQNYNSWTITKRGLGITFDAYQVGPYAAGPQYVLVPYSALKEIVEPNGPWGLYLK